MIKILQSVDYCKFSLSKKNVSLKFLIVFLLFKIIFISNIYSQHKTKVNILYAENASIRKVIERNVTSLLTEFNKAYYNKTKPTLANDIVTDEAKQRILSLWESNSFGCSEVNLNLAVVNLPDKSIELRGIPIIMKLSSDSIHTEEGVLILKNNGKINDLYFGLPAQQYRSLLSAGSNVTDFKRRQIILDFVENFRTAYNRKDVSYIENVFSDNALIIVGQVVKQESNSSGILEKSLKEDQVKLIKYSKTQYIDNLKNCFKNNKFIKVGFDNIEIIQHRLYPFIYGVPLEQTWSSTGYSDKGYLFLLISFKDENKPLILVRSWQPKDFTTPDAVIGLGDFVIN